MTWRGRSAPHGPRSQSSTEASRHGAGVDHDLLLRAVGMVEEAVWALRAAADR
jgi:hypothetical protein